MKTLMIDMDNCITDALFIERINEFLGTNYKLEDQTEFRLQKLTGDRIDEFWQFMKDKSFYDEVIIKNIYKLFLDFTEEFAKDNNMLHINVNLLDVDSLLSDVLFQKNYVFDETSDQNITFYKLIRNEKKVEGSNIYDITRRRNYTRK